MSLIRLLHRAYKCTLSPLLVFIGGPGSGCRFEPSCSDYALGAVERHGWGRGMWLAVKRIARCQPWGTPGFDPVPPVVALGARTRAADRRSEQSSAPVFPPLKLDVPASR